MRAATILFPALAAALMSTSALAERADICAELSAYVTQQEAPKQDQAPPQQAASAVQAPSRDGQRPQAGGNDPTQQSSGLSAPVTHGGAGASGPQGQAQESAASAQNNPKAEGQNVQAQNRPPEPAKPAQPAAAAPAAAAAPVAPPPSPEAVQSARTAIEAKDLLACRDAAQKMRRAGVNLPAALMALAALDPKFLQPAPDGAGTSPSP